MNVGYRVTLTQYERDELGTLLSGGRQAARKLKRAQILLAADAGVGDEEIAASVGVGGSTVYRTKRRFVEGNLERALSEEFAPRRQTQVDRQGGSPAGSDRLRKPAGGPRPMDAGPARRRDGQADCAREPVARDGAAALSRRRSQAVAPEDVVHPAGRRRLRRPHGGRARSLCRGAGPAAASGLLRREPNPAHRRGAPADPPEPGQVERYDCEYRRDGTANLFVFLDANRPWRKVKVTARRTAIDFAVCMRELADLHYPKAERIRVVLDNLSTHSAGAFYQAFPAEQARRLLRRIELHYVPKHASWLNMVEIEIGVLAGQCLDRRIESYPRLTAEVAAWEKQRNGAQARIDWSFTTEKARTKMGRAYPRPTNLKRPQRV